MYPTILGIQVLTSTRVPNCTRVSSVCLSGIIGTQVSPSCVSGIGECFSYEQKLWYISELYMRTGTRPVMRILKGSFTSEFHAASFECMKAIYSAVLFPSARAETAGCRRPLSYLSLFQVVPGDAGCQPSSGPFPSLPCY